MYVERDLIPELLFEVIKEKSFFMVRKVVTCNGEPQVFLRIAKAVKPLFSYFISFVQMVRFDVLNKNAITVCQCNAGMGVSFIRGGDRFYFFTRKIRPGTKDEVPGADDSSS